jgi:hypothetical protein
MSTYFSEAFGIDSKTLEEYGAFDPSVIVDIPVFIDPFLLFHSKKVEYVRLHQSIIEYLRFLRDKSTAGEITQGDLRNWYCFPEVKQTWLGFSKTGNDGHGLGPDFAMALNDSLARIFPAFGAERITRGSHLEKVCLIKKGVGKDQISDFTTNLIKRFLCEYTQKFAADYLARDQVRKVPIANAYFDYETEAWVTEHFVLPWRADDFILLVPRDMLTREENWINKDDMLNDFASIPVTIEDTALRAKVSNYFLKILRKDSEKGPTKQEERDAAFKTLQQFPELVDYYIRNKERSGDKAKDISAERVKLAQFLFAQSIKGLQSLLAETDFYDEHDSSHEEAHRRLAFLKDVIENKGGYQVFYNKKGLVVGDEDDLQVMFRLVWFGTPSEVTREANDGRGPVDFKISRIKCDKTLVEFKLAKNSQLKRNLTRQLEAYKKASDAKRGIKAIIFFSEDEEERVHRILRELKMLSNPDVVLIDGRRDNKPSGSRA